ncbi:MAG: hypothetical protein IJS53_05510, partial [Clostridia bacterium]|nr:hypothetical protein [Clostridia bacterium]
MLTIHGGRTRRLWPHLLASVAAQRAQGVRCVLLVPEQYTLQAERSLIDGLKLNGFFEIEVLSASRFAERLFQRYSGGRVRIDQNGKNIAMARALLSCGKALSYYTRAAQRRGFVSRAGEWVADMKRAEVSPDRLSEYADALPEGAYRDKLHDLSAIYTAYDALLQGKFVDGEDALALAIGAVEASGAVKDAAVYVYGFDMITDDFARLLCAVTRACREAHVYLVMDREDAPDGDRFAPVRDSAERLRARLREQGLRREWLWLEDTPPDAPEDVRWLEKQLLRPSPAAFGGAPESVSVFEAATPYAEAHFIAQQAVRLMRGGVAADDIFILCGNLDAYKAVLESALQAYGVPYYIAAKEPLLSHGLARFLLAALRCVTDGYRREDVIALLKSGYAPLTEDQCWRLEAYAERFSISGTKWRAPFVRGSEEEREVPEAARATLIPLLERLQASLREAKCGAESLRAPIDLLLACGAYDTLLLQEQSLVAAGMDAEVLRARQVWGRLLSLFDQLHEIAGDSRIPGRAMVSLLEAGLLENEISALPPTAGRVSVGEIGNLLPDAPRALFACGLDSGMVSGAENGLLEADEQARACEGLGAYLGMNAPERDLMADLDLWKALSAPREELFLSYAQASQAGAAQRPAPVIAAVRRMFPRLVTMGGVTDAAGSLHPLSPQQALEEIGTRLRSQNLTDEWAAAYAWLMRSPEYRPQMTALLD